MNNQPPESDLAGGMRLNKWCKLVGISKVTCWRLRKAGKLKTVTRYGIVFITAGEIKRWFEESPDDGTRVPA